MGPRGMYCTIAASTWEDSFLRLLLIFSLHIRKLGYLIASSLYDNTRFARIILGNCAPHFSFPAYCYSQPATCNHCRALPITALDQLQPSFQKSRTSPV